MLQQKRTRLVADPGLQLIHPDARFYPDQTNICLIERLAYNPGSFRFILREYLSSILFKQYPQNKKMGFEWYTDITLCETHGDERLITLLFVVLVLHDPLFFQGILLQINPCLRMYIRPYFFTMFSRLVFYDKHLQPKSVYMDEWIRATFAPIIQRNYPFIADMLHPGEQGRRSVEVVPSVSYFTTIYPDTAWSTSVPRTSAYLYTDVTEIDEERAAVGKATTTCGLEFAQIFRHATDNTVVGRPKNNTPCKTRNNVMRINFTGNRDLATPTPRKHTQNPKRTRAPSGVSA